MIELDGIIIFFRNAVIRNDNAKPPRARAVATNIRAQRVLKFSNLHVVVKINSKITAALFETRRFTNHCSSLLI
jgi:hypothetical protein